MDDNKIIELFLNREEEALVQCREKYGKYCYSIAFSIIGSHEDSEECENDAFYSAWGSIPPNKPKILSSYLGKITRNIALNKLRNKNALKRISEYSLICEEMGELVSSTADPQKDVEVREMGRIISAFLKKQSKRSRILFVGRYWNLLSVSALSEHCGMSESAVKTSLHRTRIALAEYLKKEGYII